MKRIICSAVFLFVILAGIPALAQSDFVVHATAQRFERGLMIWRSDTSDIWVLANSGRAFKFPATSYARLPDNPIPGGALRPINGFGRVWGNNAAVRAAIGFPTLGELGFDMSIAQANGAFYFQQLDGTIYQINPDYTWVRAPGMPNYPPQPSIGGFDIRPLTVYRGNLVTVTWSLLGVSQARLEVWDTASNTIIQTLNALSPSGSIQITIPTTILGNAKIALARDDGVSDLPRAETLVNVLPAPDHSVVVNAAYQPYQNGFMIWRSDDNAVYVFSGMGSGFLSTYAVDYLRSLPDNPFRNAPPNLINPINGFGRVWANVDWVRNALGWATIPEQSYAATIVLAQASPISFGLPNGRSVSVTPSGTWTLQ